GSSAGGRPSTPCRTSASIAARNAASVLPDPVGAATSTCRPAWMAGHACACAGVGAAKLCANHAATAGWNRGSGFMDADFSGTRQIDDRSAVADRASGLQPLSNLHAKDRWADSTPNQPTPLPSAIAFVANPLKNLLDVRSSQHDQKTQDARNCRNRPTKRSSPL